MFNHASDPAFDTLDVCGLKRWRPKHLTASLMSPSIDKVSISGDHLFLCINIARNVKAQTSMIERRNATGFTVLFLVYRGLGCCMGCMGNDVL